MLAGDRRLLLRARALPPHRLVDAILILTVDRLPAGPQRRGIGHKLRPLLRLVSPVQARRDVIGRALKQRYVARRVDDLRHDLRGTRPRADDADTLARECDVVAPPGGVERGASELAIAL